MTNAIVTGILVFVLVCYLVSSLDDLILDLIYIARRTWFHSRNVSVKALETDPPKRIALMIPAWKEAGVVTPMIRSTTKIANYPSSMVDYFVGVYPNDTETLNEVRALALNNKNVHCVINSKPGPTNKSQNLNEVYRAIEEHERSSGTMFEVIAIHDAEDVIHPYTFRLYSTLTNQHDAIQLPVFALPAKTNSFWGRIIAGHYADEFAENHLHHVPVREALGWFVPSAGTGYAMRRQVLSHVAQDGAIFLEGSLTEDYELSYRLHTYGYRTHFHIQRLQRVKNDGKIYNEIVAVREHFPHELNAAIKQKARWIYGITLQTPKLIDQDRLEIEDQFALWRDQKGRFTNLVHLFGYPAAIYAVLAHFMGWPTGDDRVTATLGLLLVLVTLERLTMRFFAIRSVYGWREAILANLVLPLFPLRWVVGNYINSMATLRAWRLYFWPGAGGQRGSAPKWDKTERKGYVSTQIIEKSRRKIGDNLVFYGNVSPTKMGKVLKRSQKRGQSVGKVLLENNVVREDTFIKRLAETRGLPYLHVKAENIQTHLLPRTLALKWQVAPLGETTKEIFVATPLVFSPRALFAAEEEIATTTGKTIIPVAASTKDILRACRMAYDGFPREKKQLDRALLTQSTLTPEMLEILDREDYAAASEAGANVADFENERLVATGTDLPAPRPKRKTKE